MKACSYQAFFLCDETYEYQSCIKLKSALSHYTGHLHCENGSTTVIIGPWSGIVPSGPVEFPTIDSPRNCIVMTTHINSAIASTRQYGDHIAKFNFLSDPSLGLNLITIKINLETVAEALHGSQDILSCWTDTPVGAVRERKRMSGLEVRKYFQVLMKPFRRDVSDHFDDLRVNHRPLCRRWWCCEQGKEKHDHNWDLKLHTSSLVLRIYGT